MEHPTYPKGPPRQFALLPKNIFTRLWFWYLARYMNAKRYKLTKRGRTPHRNCPIRYRQDVSMKWGTRIGLYIDDKHSNAERNYWLEQGRYDERMEAERRAQREEEERKDKARVEARKAIAAVFIGRHRQN